MKTKTCPRCEKDDKVKLEKEIHVIPMFPGEKEKDQYLFTCARCNNKFYDVNPKCQKCGKEDRVELKSTHQLGCTPPNVVNVWHCNRCGIQFETKGET